jgi:hypothetical protein
MFYEILDTPRLDLLPALPALKGRFFLAGGSALALPFIVLTSLASITFGTAQAASTPVFVFDPAALSAKADTNLAYKNFTPVFANNAFSFDGVDDYVLSSSAYSWNASSSNFTISAWVKIDPASGAHGVILGKGPVGACCAADGYPGYELRLSYDNFTFKLEDTKAGINSAYLSFPDTGLKGKWTYMTVTRLGNAYSLYINGALKTSTTTSYTYSALSSNPLTVGAGVNFGNVSKPFMGSIGRIQIDTSAKTAAEIAAAYAAEKPKYVPDFKVIRNFYYKNDADIAALGLPEATLIGAWSDADIASRVRAATLKNPKPIIVIDIEQPNVYAFDIRSTTTAAVQLTISYVSHVVDVIKAENPNAVVGLYLYAPIRDYWTPVLYNSNKSNPTYLANYQKWQAANDFLKPLANKLDVQLVSLYTFYSEASQPGGWKVYADYNIAEARRYALGKPIYVYLMTRYHAGGQYKDWRYLEASYWNMETNYVFNSTNGMVIFDYYLASTSTPQNWSTSLPWWPAVQNILNLIRG